MLCRFAIPYLLVFSSTVALRRKPCQPSCTSTSDNASSTAMTSCKSRHGPASVRDGLENALDPAGAAMQMQDAGKAVLHLQYGLVPQGQRRAT